MEVQGSSPRLSLNLIVGSAPATQVRSAPRAAKQKRTAEYLHPRILGEVLPVSGHWS
jgi:hypothetical protein